MNTGALGALKAGIGAAALSKVSYPLKETFVKALLANWFVCLAVWQATAAQVGGAGRGARGAGAWGSWRGWQLYLGAPMLTSGRLGGGTWLARVGRSLAGSPACR